MGTKADLIKEVRTTGAYTEVEARRAVEAVIAGIVQSLRATGTAALYPLGSFAIKHLQAREARNPKTGKAIQLPARRKLVFRARPSAIAADR